MAYTIAREERRRRGPGRAPSPPIVVWIWMKREGGGEGRCGAVQNKCEVNCEVFMVGVENYVEARFGNVGGKGKNEGTKRREPKF